VYVCGFLIVSVMDYGSKKNKLQKKDRSIVASRSNDYNHDYNQERLLELSTSFCVILTLDHSSKYEYEHRACKSLFFAFSVLRPWWSTMVFEFHQ
jgi:mannose/fructose/N-acetylgalactosamine-specific phosphotransferase system component IID